MLSKQVVFEGRHCEAPGLRQYRPGQVLTRVLSRPLHNKDAWERWCAVEPGTAFLPQGEIAAAHGSGQDDAGRTRLSKAGIISVQSVHIRFSPLDCECLSA